MGTNPEAQSCRCENHHMKARKLHAWDVTPDEARAIQERLRARVELTDHIGRIRTVAGADAAFDSGRGRAIAGVVLFRFHEMVEIERAWAEAPLNFPYVPGLLSFREAPALLAALKKLRQNADVLFFDGQGYAHPRRFGIACHLGVLLDRPAIGCAKSRLIGTHDEPGRSAGSWTELRDGGEVIGAVLRTRSGVRPIYVSAGHRISLERAVELTLAVTGRFRIPLPTRAADRWAAEVKGKGAGERIII